MPGTGQADLQSLGLAEPAGRFGLRDTGGQAGADLSEAGPLGGVGAQQRAAQAGLTEMILVTYPDRYGAGRVPVLTDGDWQESLFAAVAGVSPGVAVSFQSWMVR